VEDDVARPSVAVRSAGPEDIAHLAAMWQELRDSSGRLDRVLPPTPEREVLDRLHRALDNPDVRLLVATIDEEPVGMAMLTHQPFASLFDAHAVHLHALHVRSGHRRRGVGRALVASAATYAEECGADQVMTNVPPQLRETNRFYARLGFAPVYLRRSVAVAALRRKLCADSRSGALEEMLSRRRTLRTRAGLQRVPQPLTPR
jgi:GNAT superfamily N-acetyltransferase